MLSAVDRKAVRLVATHRVLITFVSDEILAGTVRGDHGMYHVTVDPEGHHCHCPTGAYSERRCSHVTALLLAHLWQHVSEGVR